LGAAGFGAALGLRVVLIDKRAENFGGDCLNYGCVPSKALLHVAQLFHGGRAAEAFGLSVGGRADFQRVMAYVHRQQDVIRAHETPEFLTREWGVNTLLGAARLTGKQSVEINGQTLTAPKIVLATGSVPRTLRTPGVEEVTIYDNESLFWELDTLPKHLLVVGGGPIGCEMAQAFRRLGSRVTLVNRGARLLERDPERQARILEKRLRAEGVEIFHNTEVGVFTTPTSCRLTSTLPAPAEPINFTHVLAAIGREVRTQGLGLEVAGVQVQNGKILTDDYFRTTNPFIYAVGDAFGREQFSHGAELHNITLWNNLLSPLRKRHDLRHFSWVTFTDPEIACFGRSRADLEKAGVAFVTEEIPFGHDDRAIATDAADGHLTLYLSRGSFWRGPRILGGCMAAPAAGEMIQELQLLAQLGLPMSTLTQKIYAYPVASRVNQIAARQRAQAGLLTERNKRLARWWYRLRYGGIKK